jgi:hypothetical protein
METEGEPAPAPGKLTVTPIEGFRALAAEPFTAAVPVADSDDDDLEDENARLEVLKRQVETKAKLMGQNTSAE